MPEPTPLFRKPRLIAASLSPAERVLRSHDIVTDAARTLHDGSPGSGVKALGFAASTQLALTIGPDAAATFFELLADQARNIRPDPGDAA